MVGHPLQEIEGLGLNLNPIYAFFICEFLQLVCTVGVRLSFCSVFFSGAAWFLVRCPLALVHYFFLVWCPVRRFTWFFPGS
jgi:hypothetical protein